MQKKIKVTPELLDAMEALQIFGGANTNGDINDQCSCNENCDCPTYKCMVQPTECEYVQSCGNTKYHSTLCGKD